MRFLGSVVAVALLVGGVEYARAGGAAAEMKKLEGTWLVAHRAYTPSPTTDPVGKLLTGLGSVVEIGDGKVTAPDNPGQSLSITIKASATPKGIDLKVPGENGQVLPGVYVLEDDVLSLAVSTNGVRPKTATQGKDQVLLILKRKPSNP